MQTLPEKQKSHEIFRSIASTVDIPNRWDPRAKQSRTVALLAALRTAALFEPLPSRRQADKKKNQYTLCTGFSWCDGRDSNPRPTDSSRTPGDSLNFWKLRFYVNSLRYSAGFELRVSAPFARFETVQKPCRNRALTPGQTKNTSSDNDLTALVRATAHQKSSSFSIHTPGHRHPRQNPDL